jgi:hypothetical protein
MSAVRVDEASGLEERLEFVDTPRARLYTWSARPPDAGSCVVVCSSVLADFTANYDRERALGLAVAARGHGAIRFHYAGEGNSEGERRDMTLTTMGDDAAAILDHARSLGFDRFAMMGTRIGALVAARAATASGAAPLALWEPVHDPQRFLVEARRADRISRASRGDDEPSGDWRRELDSAGRLDLIGYDVYQPMMDSLAGVRLVDLLGASPRPVLLASFRTREGINEPIYDGLVAAGFPVDRRTYGLNESWWFHSAEEARDHGGLVEDTADWLDEKLREAK